MAIQFHETVMGHRFFEQQLPQLIKAVNRLAAAMEEANKINAAPKKATTVSPTIAAESKIFTAAHGDKVRTATHAISAVDKALMAYEKEHIDVVLNEETGWLDIIWHDEKNSFLIQPGIAPLEHIDRQFFINALDIMGVGHCF